MALIQTNIFRLRGVEAQLKRIADGLWALLQHEYGIYEHPPHADTSGEPPFVTYVDEQKEALREQLEAMGLPTTELDKESPPSIIQES